MRHIGKVSHIPSYQPSMTLQLIYSRRALITLHPFLPHCIICSNHQPYITTNFSNLTYFLLLSNNARTGRPPPTTPAPRNVLLHWHVPYFVSINASITSAHTSDPSIIRLANENQGNKQSIVGKSARLPAICPIFTWPKTYQTLPDLLGESEIVDP